jgi:phosphate starvation-inducible protein PhoH and related proteins
MPKPTRNSTRTRDRDRDRDQPPASTRPPKQFHLQPKTQRQAELIRAIDSSDIVLALGPAGVGKTYIAASKIANLYLSGKYDTIILARSAVGPGQSIGFFPGDIKDKLSVWLMPIISVLKRQLTPQLYSYLLAKDIIQYQPEECIRGMSFEKSLVLVDEIQNCDWPTIKAVSTRLGEGSKMVWMGDVRQSDTNDGRAVLEFARLCNKHNINIPVVQFTSDDIVRSDIVGDIVRMLEREGL